MERRNRDADVLKNQTRSCFWALKPGVPAAADVLWVLQKTRRKKIARVSGARVRD